MNYKDLIFLDLETTGLDPRTDQIIEAAYYDANYNRMFASLFGITGPLPHDVSGLTNIDQSDIEGLEQFMTSNFRYNWKSVSGGTKIAVAHNAQFDLSMLAPYGIDYSRVICTYMIAWKRLRHLPNHKLGTLRSYYGIKAQPGAHRADADVSMLKAIFDQMLKKEFNGSVDAMFRYSYEARVEYDDTWHFGQYKGRRIDPVAHSSYMDWVVNKSNFGPSIKEKIRRKMQNSA